MEFSTLHLAFTGEGIPPISEDATPIRVASNTIVFVNSRGEAWESFVGKGTSLKSQTFYWPDLGMCPRAWAEQARASGNRGLEAI